MKEAVARQSQGAEAPLQAPEVQKPSRPFKVLDGGELEEMKVDEALTEAEMERRYQRYQKLDAGKPILDELRRTLDAQAQQKLEEANKARSRRLEIEDQIQSVKQRQPPSGLEDRVAFVQAQSEERDGLDMQKIALHREEAGLRFDAQESLNQSNVIRQGLELLDRGEASPELFPIVSDQIALVHQEIDEMRSRVAAEPQLAEEITEREKKRATLKNFLQSLHELKG